MKYLLTIIIFVSMFAVTADSTVFDETETTEINIQKLRIENAKSWDLDIKQWKKYETLMKGKRGIWTPNLDPLTVLGINASSTYEMKMFAEKLVHVERKRAQRELRFEKAYQDAQKRLYGNIPLYVIKPKSRLVTGYGEAKNVVKIDYFMKIPCEDCSSTIKNWLGNRIKINLYFVDTSPQVIKHWARVNKIPPEYVRSGRISLNMGDVQAKERGITEFPYLVEYTKE